MVGWHHRFDRHEQALGVGEGQGGLVCGSPWGRRELDTTERLKSKGDLPARPGGGKTQQPCLLPLWAEVSAEEQPYFERLFHDAQSAFPTFLGPQK